MQLEPELFYADELMNAIDSLEVSLLLIDRENDFKWKYVLMALNHSLYSLCICCLRNGSNSAVTGRGNKDDGMYYTRNNIYFKKSSKAMANYCKNAYRIIWNNATLQEVDEKRNKYETNFESLSIEEQNKMCYKDSDILIGFWSALARVMDGEYWMERSCITKPLALSDKELMQIEYIHDLRNDFEHFVPKLGIYPIDEIKDDLLIYCKAISFLINESNSISFIYDKSNIMHKIELIDSIKKRLL